MADASSSPRPALVREFAKVVKLSPRRIEDTLRKALARLEERVKEQEGLKLAELNDYSDLEEVPSVHVDPRISRHILEVQRRQDSFNKLFNGRTEKLCQGSILRAGMRSKEQKRIGFSLELDQTRFYDPVEVEVEQERVPAEKPSKGMGFLGFSKILGVFTGKGETRRTEKAFMSSKFSAAVIDKRSKNYKGQKSEKGKRSSSSRGDGCDNIIGARPVPAQLPGAIAGDAAERISFAGGAIEGGASDFSFAGQPLLSSLRADAQQVGRMRDSRSGSVSPEIRSRDRGGASPVEMSLSRKKNIIGGSERSTSPQAFVRRSRRASEIISVKKLPDPWLEEEESTRPVLVKSNSLSRADRSRSLSPPSRLRNAAAGPQELRASSRRGGRN
ncbi:hypothetical protein GUITHDRAFT_122357 [Guillardia theta CCMP2712]|uniref:Uncharacterized protein n=1 Tax=Guillardia theta (strain CCMP2712) TaxID=905079 RepID=L1I6D6_GUITC|nr:hypothetical protein GUITHDRAFT_122357 [Guillardia theta CCMP2712]EKX31449.1 hypothetical protein GUITHDRAFT_122357 [Guillardia theta CCMP2712]|eukprot:XP_005818429.1 hypothetical protein GUITHDRAFT_122357 [Guillardia theta CCMP2712]